MSRRAGNPDRGIDIAKTDDRRRRAQVSRIVHHHFAAALLRAARGEAPAAFTAERGKTGR